MLSKNYSNSNWIDDLLPFNFSAVNYERNHSFISTSIDPAYSNPTNHSGLVTSSCVHSIADYLPEDVTFSFSTSNIHVLHQPDERLVSYASVTASIPNELSSYSIANSPSLTSSSADQSSTHVPTFVS